MKEFYKNSEIFSEIHNCKKDETHSFNQFIQKQWRQFIVITVRINFTAGGGGGMEVFLRGY